MRTEHKLTLNWPSTLGQKINTKINPFSVCSSDQLDDSGHQLSFPHILNLYMVPEVAQKTEIAVEHQFRLVVHLPYLLRDFVNVEEFEML